MLLYFTFIISENDEIYERKECIITQNAKKHYTTVNKPAIEILTVRLISWLPDLNNSILYKSYTQVKWQILLSLSPAAQVWIHSSSRCNAQP